MGEKLLQLYKFVGDEKGMSGKIELAKMTKVPSAKAAFEQDSPELITVFINAAKNITGKEPPISR